MTITPVPIPEHPHVPACDTHRCEVCPCCGTLHHNGSLADCTRCFMVKRGWLKVAK